MIEITETAPLNSVQDAGRIGARRWGIGPSGAMDRLALATANALLGNAHEAAVLEVQMFPVRFAVLADVAFAVTGANCNARLDGRLLPPWWVAIARAGQVLELQGVSAGVRGYLAITGGIDVPVVLGSRSTALRDGFGGLQGRAIMAGDVLQPTDARLFATRDTAGYGIEPPMSALSRPACPDIAPCEIAVRVIPASEHEQFDEPSRSAFWAMGWSVTSRSNRQGYQLNGSTPLLRTEALEMRSHAIVPGTIQVPPSGQPIIQLADANSAGGYPKIGVVVAADLWRIAQAPPGRALRFVHCDVAGARAAAAEVAAYVAEVAQLARHVRNGGAG